LQPIVILENKVGPQLTAATRN